MKSLTNKSLVFLVFCVIGHTMVSADVEVCKLRVHEVFKKNQSPFFQFLEALSDYNEQYFTSTVQNDEALGYFKILISPIKDRDTVIMSPKKLCKKLKKIGHLLNLDESMCLEALSTMLTYKGANSEAITDIEHMSGNKAFIYVYLNHIYDTMRQYMEERMNANPEAETSGNQDDDQTFKEGMNENPESESGSNQKDVLIIHQQINIMQIYYEHMIGVANKFDPKIFPTVDQYCKEAEADEQQEESSENHTILTISHTIVSADVEVCKVRVHEVFKENQTPFFHFLRALSEYNEQYFTTTVQNDEALGYFKFLISPIQNHLKIPILSPKKLCRALRNKEKLLILNETSCYEGLQTMLTHNDTNLQAKEDVDNMSGTDALIFVYLNHIYDDMRQYMEGRLNANSGAESNEAESSSQPDVTIMHHQISIMFIYYNQMTLAANKLDATIFPTVEEYCIKEEDDKEQGTSTSS